jgi:hypothetical protein
MKQAAQGSNPAGVPASSVTTTSSRSRTLLLSRFLWFLVIAGLALYAALTLWLALAGIFFPYQLDYGEGIVLWFTRQLALGQPIYFPLGESFASSNYPPGFMLLAATLYPLFGDSYVWGRWLNLAAVFVVTAVIIRLVRGETRDWRAALVAAAFFFGSTFIYHWSPLFRVDLTGLAWTMAGVFCVWRWEKIVAGRRSPVAGQAVLYLIAAIIFFLAALYTKHSLLFAPAAAVLAIYLRDRKSALLFALALALIGIAIFAGMEWATRGGWSFGLITLNATVWTPRVFLHWMQTFLVTYAVLIILGAWSWVRRVARGWRDGKGGIGILEIYAVAAFVALALAGREGAWENYFFEAVVMVCVFAGFAIAREWNELGWRWALPLVLLLQLALFWNEHDPRIAASLLAQTRAGNEQLASIVRAAPGTVISEDMGLLVTNGKPVAYYTFPYSTLARAGRWDQHWEIENLRTGRFPLVVLMQGTRADVDRFGNVTRAFVSALDYGYGLVQENPRFQVYAPAALQHFDPHAKFEDKFELVGWSVTPEELHAGETLNLTIVWRALRQPNARYTTFAHLEDANGAVIAQDDHEPSHGAYPTTRWAQDELVRETYSLRVPSALKRGEYVLRVGWYDSESQERLSTRDSTDSIQLRDWDVP